MLAQQQQFFFCCLEVSILPSRDAAVNYKKELDRLNPPYSKIIMTSDPTKHKQKGWDKYELVEKEKEIFEKLFNLSIEESIFFTYF